MGGFKEKAHEANASWGFWIADLLKGSGGGTHPGTLTRWSLTTPSEGEIERRYSIVGKGEGAGGSHLEGGGMDQDLRNEKV